MKRAFLWAPALFIATPVFAQRAPTCPDGGSPAFNGHPFRPIECVAKGQKPAFAEARLSSATLPFAIDDDGTSLKPLIGRWQGMVVSGDSRYELRLDLSGSGRKHRLEFSTMDYRTHLKHEFECDLKSPLWSKGPPTLTLRLKVLPDQRLAGKAWIGAAKPPAELDRAAVVGFSGRPDYHEIVFSVIGNDRLKFAYTHHDPRRGAARTAGELVRQR